MAQSKKERQQKQEKKRKKDAICFHNSQVPRVHACCAPIVHFFPFFVFPSPPGALTNEVGDVGRIMSLYE